jgi:outer membrane protein assembly factor BamB
MIRFRPLWCPLWLLSAAWFALLSTAGRADDWPQFRGPTGQGIATARDVPLAWSETENIAWKAAVAGRGWSSPAIRGDVVWLTTALDEGHSLRAVALDRASGKTLHDVEVFTLETPGSIHAHNSHASPTPVVEADRVYVHFGAHGTACLASDGRVLWRTQELKYDHRHGPAGSPVVWNDLLFINCDGTDVQFVVALDKRTGQIRWKQARRHISEPRKSGEKEVPMAYCTPLVLELDGRPQLVTLGSDALVAHDPASGEELWWFSYSGYSNVAMPAYDDGLMFLSSGFGAPTFYAIRPGGRGDITESGLVWKVDKASQVPLDVSPLATAGRVLTITDAGIGTCYDAASGKPHWSRRLGGKYWASPVYAEGRIYCVAEDAETTVLAAGDQLEILATNKLDGHAQASPAVVDGAIFLRTDTHLYRIGKP